MKEKTQDFWMQELKRFLERGGDEALFWAGRMSSVVNSIRKSDVLELSEWLSLLFWVANQYDDVMVRRAIICSEKDVAFLKKLNP